MQSTFHTSIFEYITDQEAAYKLPIPINDVWEWSMYEHLKLSTLYKNSQLSTGKSEFKPVKNITRPILNVQYRSEGFDLKDIVLFVDDVKNYFKSFLAKKFHEKWARENGIDTVIDAMVESFVDYGGALLKNVGGVKPEVVPLTSIAFCDQTGILSGPIGLKHYYSPDQLLEMADKGWGDVKNKATATLEETTVLSREEKVDDKTGQIAKTPGKYIEIYEIHGNLPRRFLNPGDTSGTYVRQFHIVCFYKKKDNTKGYITLYAAEEKESLFKIVLRDVIYGRGLGFGGAEELFEAQVWVNYDMIRMQDMLDAASKTILKTTDPAVASKNKIHDMENLEIVELAPNTDLNQVDTFPRNKQLFDVSIAQWEEHAQQMGAATEALLGESPKAGTPFKLQDLITRQGQGLHEYRKGKLATFWDEVERDWIIPHLAKEIAKEHEFLAELDLEELQDVSEALVQCETEKMKKEYVLNNGGLAPTDTQIDTFKEKVGEQFRKKGKKHFIKILEKEMKDLPISVRTSVVGKQKNLSEAVDKLVNIFRFAFSNPQGFAATMQIPGMSKAFNGIIEYAGLSPIDFSGIEKLAMAPEKALPSPLQTEPQAEPLAV